jgi:hypothetical protein
MARMRQPLQAKSQSRQQIVTVKTFPSAVGGWNASDSLAEMSLLDAVVLNNWFPRTSYVEFRGGYASHATGTTNNVKTLGVHNAMTGNSTMWAMTATGIYNVSSAGAVGASALARTNGKHQWTMFGDGTNNWLIACNGVDSPAYFDGTTWTAVDAVSTPALTGVTSSQLIQPLMFKGRLMFVQISTLSFWYLAAGAAGGALSEFDLSGEFPRGGFLMAMGTWTRDAGDGADDVFVAVSSQGECVVYQGTNPSSANTWEKVGTYFVGKPIGRRCLQKLGGDLVILTENGAFPLSAAMQSAVIDYKMALSFKIENAFTDSARSYGGVFGWETTIYPAYGAMIVNVPQAEDGTHEQYVMNTITKSWCKFTDWHAECFAIFNGELYFGTGTTVKKAWTGTSDGGSNINFYAKQAFSNFKDDRLKQVTLYMPILAVNGGISYLTDVDVDFEDDEIIGTAIYTVVSGAQWDVDNWDEGMWAQGLEIVHQPSSPQEWPGTYLAVKLKVTSNSLMGQWVSNQLQYEIGGPI